MEYSLADIRAVSNNDGMFGGNGSWLIIILLFLFGFGGFGNGFGRGGETAYATSADVQRGFDTNAVTNKLNGIENGLSSLGFTLQSQIASCCCETNRNIDSVKLEMCHQTNVLAKAIHDEGEATRGLITTNLLAEKDRQISVLQTQAIASAQTQTILDAQGRYVTNPPCVPAYPCGSACCGIY